jgi:pyruvate/2-oxoglutarate dehydrogenase complex dihydrolipoamide acyltransferase (E2) component
MPKQQQKPAPRPQEPGPGRSTSEAAFNALRKEIAQRNERTHQDARKVRAVHEREQIRKRQERDAL